MPNKDNKILKYNYGEKLLKAPFIIYADLDCLLEKMRLCQNNPGKSYTEKKTKHTLSGYPLFINSLFDLTKRNLIVTKVKIVWKSFVKTREHATEIIPLADKENKFYQKQKVY